MLSRTVLFSLALAAAAPVHAQGFNPFGDNHVTTGAYRSGPSSFGGFGAQPPGSLSAPAYSPDGGGRPSISGSAPPLVQFQSSYGAGNIVIDSGGRALYLVVSSSQALRYPIAVGREGFRWTGVERVSRKAEWPDWRPPAEMRERQPGLPEVMSGGLRNPLGARAIYLGSTLYRIHGTNDTRSIGSASSSGCFRMANNHVVDLYNRVSTGATVHVVGRLPASIARGVVESDSDDDDRPAATPPVRRKRAS